MKIVLINPPSPFEKEPAMNPPLGLCYLSSYAKLCGYHDIQIIDYSLYDYDYYYDTAYLHRIPLDAEVYGITGVTAQYKWIHDISVFLKSRNKRAWIIAGGPHASALPKDCTEDCCVDYVIKGEGEINFVNLLNIRRDNKLWMYTNLERTKVMPDNYVVDDIDSYPFPDRNCFDIEKYKRRIEGKPAMHIVTLRGCSYGCRYCSGTRGKKVRYRSIKNVFIEIDHIIKKYGVKSFVIYDDIFTLNRERVKEFCIEAKRRALNWRCFSRTDKVDNGLLKKMRSAGLTSITFGVESGDDGILSNINKQSSVKANKKALLAAKKVGVPVRCSLMYGNPGEDKRTLINTVEFINETQPDEWNLAVLSPIPGSVFWDNPKRYGLKFDKHKLKKNWYLDCNRFGESGIGNIYITIDSMSDREFKKNLVWFVQELERVCPRKQVQDTIQNIRIS